MSDVALVACEVFKDRVTELVDRGIVDATPYFVDPACHTNPNDLEYALRRILPVACRYFDHVIVLYGRCHSDIQQIVADYQAVRVDVDSCLDVVSPGELDGQRATMRVAELIERSGPQLSSPDGALDSRSEQLDRMPAAAELVVASSRPFDSPYREAGGSDQGEKGSMHLAYLIRESVLKAEIQAMEIENGQMKQQLGRLRKMNAKLMMFDDINRELSTNLDLDNVAGRLVNKAVELTGAEESSLVLCDSDQEKQQFRCLAVSQNVKFTGSKRVLSVTSLAGWVARNRQPLVIKRGAQDLPVPDAQFIREKVTSYIGLPLLVGGRTVAVLQVFNLPVSERAENYARGLASLTAVGAIALQNAISHRLVKQERNKLNAIFNKVSDAIRLVDSRLIIVDMNAAAEALTGWSLQEAIGRSCCEVYCCRASMGGLRPRSEVCPIQQVLSRGEAIPYAEGTIRCRDGKAIEVVSSFAPVIAVSGWREYVAAVDRDVSQVKELERLKSEFIAAASHELRTPLASIVSAAETLMRRDIAIPRRMRGELLEMIRSSAQRLSRMTDDLARAAQIDHYDLRLEIRPTDIGPLIERIVRQFRFQTAGHTITLEIPSRLPPVLADANRFEDVMVNLLSNAVKYSPEGSDVRVRVALRQREGYETERTCGLDRELVIAVSDQGVGIASDEVDRVFQRFYRGKSVLPHQTSGMGLGLSICKTYVESMNGEIWVESTKGKGSTFSFSLPVFEAQ